MVLCLARRTSSHSSGGSHYGTTHPGLGYSVLNNEQPDADSTALSEMPGLEPGDFGVGPVYGPHMPGSFSSPVHEPEILSYGDVAGAALCSC